ncbi:hypothetical protein GCM10023149_14180 [Mucilaginibacter gynuensis]|uniref:Uncharacterized protein n=1 Tax=Mucilaginibacter gynuensis TaxID=1302236 RepID=A0ABP8G3R6_9SPHI
MTHVINSLLFETRCPDETLSFNLRYNFAQTYQQQITEVIDEVCSQYVTDDELIQIDKLELDLGVFSTHTLGTDFKSVLRATFEKQLSQHLSKTEPAKRQQQTQLSQAETLAYFLLNGTLPWFANEDGIDINEIAQKVLVNQANMFRHFFYQNRFKAWVWQRVLFQLNPASKQLVIQLAPDLKKSEELFTVWITALTNKATGLSSNTALQQQLADVSNVLLHNAQLLFKEPDDVQLLHQVFENHIEEIFKSEAVLVARLKTELTGIIAGNSSIPTASPISKEQADELIKAAIANAESSVPATFASESETAADEGEKYAVKYAGIVLLHPFLKTFFTRLNLLDDNQWKNMDAAFRAVHLLKYLSNGEQEVPEYSLVFEKILCGLSVNTPIPLNVQLTPDETEQATMLLTDVIGHWSALKNSSIDALRETFLKRDGLITKKENSWLLQVEQKTFDVLLDMIPWGYATISLPWNKYLLYVEW